LKKAFALILFFLFALRPAYNVGYVLYYELNIDYIINTYCINKEKPQLQCNGKCHLMKQLNIDTSTSSEDQLAFQIVEAFFPLYFQEASDVHTSYTESDFQKPSTYYTVVFPENRAVVIDHPPQMCVFI